MYYSLSLLLFSHNCLFEQINNDDDDDDDNDDDELATSHGAIWTPM